MKYLADKVHAYLLNKLGRGLLHGDALIWKVLTLQANGRRVLILPQVRRIQRAVRKFLLHRRWLGQARLVSTGCMLRSCTDLVAHIYKVCVK